jgi:hypothetical protein
MFVLLRVRTTRTPDWQLLGCCWSHFTVAGCASVKLEGPVMTAEPCADAATAEVQISPNAKMLLTSTFIESPPTEK